MSRRNGTKALFAGRHFDREVILLCVRWYLRYKLSLRDLVEMMAERGLELAHTTIMRWVQRYVPEFEKSWARYARKVGRSWLVDETYLKVRGRWVYLYRAMDKEGNIVDLRLSPKRDVAAAKAFFLNNLIEQDHRGIKSRTGPMLGFKRFDYAAITIAGIELLRRIHKGQFAFGSLRLKDHAAPAI
jgi:transposase-like protein